MLWPEIMMAIERMSAFNEESQTNPLVLAFYDNLGDLWQIQKCGKLAVMDKDKL